MEAKKIWAIIEEAENMRGAYFFLPPTNAGGRRSYEKYHSHGPITWQDGKDTYTAEFSVKCSCSNVYASGTYTKNGKKTTLTAVKNSYYRLKQAEEETLGY